MRKRLILRNIFAVLLGMAFIASSDLRVALAALSDQPLVQQSDIVYKGSFSVPEGDGVGCNGSTGAHCFTYGGVFGYNPNNNSLFMHGHAWVGGAGEVKIPPNFSSTATLLQNIYDVADGKQVDPGEVNGQGPSFGFVYNNRLILSGSTYYDADGTQVNTHGVSGFNFSLPNDFNGWFRFDPSTAANPRSLGGYMTNIPTEWQSVFGGPALTGNCCLSIISNSSAGPAASVFNPDDVGVTNPIQGKTVLFYPLSNPLASVSTQNNLFNLATKMGGIAFPPGSRSILFFGMQGTGPYCYGCGIGQGASCPSSGCGLGCCIDPVSGYEGTHAYPYRHQVWAYDANDLLAVKNGAKQPWDPRPYAIWTLSEMNSSGSATISGAVYDSTTGKLYITQAFGSNPTVHVYQITVSGTTPPTDTTPPSAPSRLRIR